MNVITGKVVGGKVVLEGALPDGVTVTVLAPEEGEFTLDAEDEAALLASISEANRDEVIDGESVLRRLGGFPE